MPAHWAVFAGGGRHCSQRRRNLLLPRNLTARDGHPRLRYRPRCRSPFRCTYDLRAQEVRVEFVRMKVVISQLLQTIPGGQTIFRLCTAQARRPPSACMSTSTRQIINHGDEVVFSAEMEHCGQSRIQWQYSRQPKLGGYRRALQASCPDHPVQRRRLLARGRYDCGLTKPRKG